MTHSTVPNFHRCFDRSSVRSDCGRDLAFVLVFLQIIQSVHTSNSNLRISIAFDNSRSITVKNVHPLSKHHFWVDAISFIRRASCPFESPIGVHAKTHESSESAIFPLSRSFEDARLSPVRTRQSDALCPILPQMWHLNLKIFFWDVALPFFSLMFTRFSKRLAIIAPWPVTRVSFFRASCSFTILTCSTSGDGNSSRVQ